MKYKLKLQKKKTRYVHVKRMGVCMRHIDWVEREETCVRHPECKNMNQRIEMFHATLAINRGNSLEIKLN